MTNADRAQDMHPSDVEALLDERDELRAALATLRARLREAAEQQDADAEAVLARTRNTHAMGMHQCAALAYRACLVLVDLLESKDAHEKSWLDKEDGKWSLQQCPDCMRSFEVHGATPRERIATMDRRAKERWVCDDCKADTIP